MRHYLLLLSLLIFSQLYGQNTGISYQAVIYNPTGEELPGVDNPFSPLTNSAICVRFGLYDNNNVLEYEEVLVTATDDFGMINVLIGPNLQTGGYANAFEDVVWDANSKFLKVDIDIDGACIDFEDLSYQPFTYVPFAYYSPASDIPGPQGPEGPQGIQGPQGTPGLNGNGINNTTDNGDGTFTFTYDDGSSFTTSNLTGPQGPAGATGPQGAIGPQGVQGPQGIQGPQGTPGLNGNGINNTTDNGDGTFTFTYDDGSTFTTSDLTGPQGPMGAAGATGPQGAVGPQGPAGATGTPGLNGNGINNTTDNGDGTFTFTYDDGSTFTTSDLTGPQGPAGAAGATGPQGAIGPQGIQGPQGAVGSSRNSRAKW